MSELHQIAGCANPARRADVVFIHGLGGDPFATWRNGDDQAASWPHWMGNEFPDVGVWSLGYAASPSRWPRMFQFMGRLSPDAGYSMALPDRAAQVLDLMVQRGFGERPILFICHSLGGLLLKQLLRKSCDSSDQRKQRIAGQTRAVLFLATPHTGARLASLANAFRTVLGTTVSMEELRAHDAHLRDLYDWYRNHSRKLEIHTATYYEEREVNGVLSIVNPSSAHPGVGEDPVSLDKDHLSIAKPTGPDEQVCGAARNLLNHHVLVAAPAVPRPPVAPDPSAGAMPQVPCEMPPAPARLFGREQERQQVAGRLRAGLNTAVSAPAGFGKTALAAHALQDVVGAQGTRLRTSPFPDGLVYLDLYTFQGEAEPAWSALANRLRGAAFMEQRSGRDRAAEACRGQRILVIIEGGEEADGQGERTTISELFSVLAPENRWLLLTRVRGQSAADETVRIQESLAPADAGALLDSLVRHRALDGEVRAAILALLEGHPLALNWAGNLLALDEEDPVTLVSDWEERRLPGLSDPRESEHTLHWLFERSARGLDEVAKQALAVAGLLAHAPFSFETVMMALGQAPGQPTQHKVRDALRDLARRGLLRHIGNDCWQCSHVLGYRFARDENGSDKGLRERLGQSLYTRIGAALQANPTEEMPAAVGRDLEHAAALLRADPDQGLWDPLASGLLYDVATRLDRLGRLDLLASALSAVSGWLTRLGDESGVPAYWVGQACVLMMRRGEVLRKRGDLMGALKGYRDALRFAKLLVEADPDNPAWERNVAMSLERIGDVLLVQANLADALTAYREALDVSMRLAECGPSPQYQRDLTVSRIKLGDALRIRGDMAGALAHYREALATRQSLAQAYPSDIEMQRDLGVCHERIGDVLRDQGDLGGALAAFRQSQEVTRQLAESDPSNMIWQEDACVTRNKLGDVLASQGDLTGALAAYQATLVVRKRLAELDPLHTGWQRDLGVSRNKVGDTLRIQGNLVASLASHREAFAVCQRLVEADPSNAEWQRDLCVTRNKIGDVLRAQNDLEGALAAYRASQEVTERLAEAEPLNVRRAGDLGFIRERIGDILRAQGDLEGALALYRQAMAARETQADADVTNPEWQREVTISQKRIADVLHAQGDLKGALEIYQASLVVSERLARAYPANVEWQRDLGIGYDRIAALRRDEGNLPEAVAACQASLAISRRVAGTDPSNAAWLHTLSFSLTRMAGLYADQGARDQALELAEESLAIDQRLAALDPSNALWKRDLEISSAFVAGLREGRDDHLP